MARRGVIPILIVLLSAFLAGQLWAQERDEERGSSAHRAKIVSFEVGKDETLSYPSNLVNLPDEHTTFIPLKCSHPVSAAPREGEDAYLVFASSKVAGGNGGAVALETTDLKTFTFATDRGYSEQVMNPPVDFTSCNANFNTEFDENYAAPGSVVQNPALAPGNLIMFYEAENHCPGGNNQQPYYATVGYATSSDFGRSWPPPVDSEFGGPARHPVLKSDVPEPAANGPYALGDAIPSAFVDHDHIYVAYSHAAGPQSDGLVRVARAKLDGNDQARGDDHSGPGGGPDQPLEFFKWYNGSFSQPGIAGLDTGPVPGSGCPGRQGMAEIGYNDDLGLYFMIFVCNSFSVDGYGSWYYSTATSLDRQDWTPPQMILGSRQLIVGPCNLKDKTGNQFDGFYPSFMSPGAQAGHTRLTGKVFFMSGCDTGLPRAFASRDFRITVER